MRVYVASPYQLPQAYYSYVTADIDQSEIDRFIDHRARAAKNAAANLQLHAFSKGHSTWFYTPIGYEHSVILNELAKHPPLAAQASHMKLNHEYWINIDLKVLESMQGMVILGLPGWTLSTGIRKELAWMTGLVGAPIVTLPLSPRKADPTGYDHIAIKILSERLHALDLKNLQAFHGFPVATQYSAAVEHFQ